MRRRSPKRGMAAARQGCERWELDAGLAHLAALDGLQILKLKNTDVSDDGLEWLKECTALHTLVLTGTKVSDAGVMRLQRARPELKVVR